MDFVAWRPELCVTQCGVHDQASGSSRVSSRARSRSWSERETIKEDAKPVGAALAFSPSTLKSPSQSVFAESRS